MNLDDEQALTLTRLEPCYHLLILLCFVQQTVLAQNVALCLYK